MKKLLSLLLVLPGFVFAQDQMLILSAEIDGVKTSIDSIVFQNVTQSSSRVFEDLPEYDYYQINLSKGEFWGTLGVDDVFQQEPIEVIGNIPGSFRFQVSNTRSDILVSVYTLNGRLVERREFGVHQNMVEITIGRSGLYVVGIQHGHSRKAVKVLGVPGSSEIQFSLSSSATDQQMKANALNNHSGVMQGDSIKVSIFKSGYYAIPYNTVVHSNENLTADYKFEEIVPAEFMEFAHIDEVGRLDSFSLNGQTLYYSDNDEFNVYQGDILLTNEQIALGGLKGASSSDRNFIRLWPDGIVNYVISEDFPNSERIATAMEHYENETPIRFRDVSGYIAAGSPMNYVCFARHDKITGSRLGMVGFKQYILVEDIANYGNVIHEIGHTLGLVHEHCRSDRDEYVQVFKDNITEDSYKMNYSIPDESMVFGEFDWFSIMLYSAKMRPGAINKNKPVMVRKSDGVEFYAQRRYLSRTDVKSIEELYGHLRNPKVETTMPVDMVISPEGAELGGKILDEGEAEVTSVGFFWKEFGGTYEIFESASSNLNFTAELKDLSPNTIYFYYAFAENEYGIGKGSVVKFITSPEPYETGSVTDARDGKEYKTVKIGSQWWMAENLAYLPKIDVFYSQSDSDPHYYVNYYLGSDLDEARETNNYKAFGTLFNWPAAQTACPNGWHLPSISEWRLLAEYINALEGPYDHIFDAEEYMEMWNGIGGHLKSETHWNGTNDFGFSAFAGGYYDHLEVTYLIPGYVGAWWSSTESDRDENPWFTMVSDPHTFLAGAEDKKAGLSIRCVKN